MATSIAIVRTEQFIVIAADSKAVDENGKAANAPECKIRTIGKFVYVANNFTEDSAGGYNLHRIIENSGAQDSLGALATTLRGTIPGPLIKALTLARQRNPAKFRDNFKTLQAMGVVLAGVERDRPSLVDLRFSIEDLEASSIKLRIDEHRCPGPDCPDGVASVFVPDGLAERFEREHSKYWTGNADSVAKSAQTFVQMAINEGLSDVGPPISVLVIGPNGLDWRLHKPCDTASPEP